MESTDHQNPKLNNVTSRTVESADEHEMVLKVVNQKSGYVRHLAYTPDLALVSTRNEKGTRVTYEPPLPYFKFPLKAGEVWSAESVEKTDGVVTNRHSIRGKVVGRETISEAVGNFNAWKISIESSVTNPEGKTTLGTDTSWYVPELGRSVRSDLTAKNPDGSGFSSKTVRMISKTPD